tara:strand:- start:353 stop:1072 length:720 start_codon:yes stop_codon:yes gene_type:complete
MKTLITLFTLSLSSVVFGDAGISIGYRSVPTTIWKNESVTPKHEYDTINGVYRRSLNVITLNVFFDDTLKGHDREGADKESFWPDWIRPSKGAGYIMGLNFNYGAEEGLVEYYSTDLYIGKRYFILPHLFHLYFKIGPSLATFNYDMVSRYMGYTRNIGGFYNLGFQVMVSKGIKVYGEAEFRGYSSASYSEFNIERNKVQFNNILPGWTKNYKHNTYDKGWLRGLVTDGIRFGLKFTF